MLMLTGAVVHADARRDAAAAREHVAFGIHVAQAGLWAEAAFQFDRATRLDPTYAAAFNNLAIAYEQLGRLTDARQLYARALALDPENRFVRDNYERFVDIDDRRERPLASAATP
jgi:Flp pilus assembly protein TadD